MRKLAYFFVILLALSACGRGSGDESGEAENGGAFGLHLGDSFSLTISTPAGNANMNIEAAAARLTNRLAAEGIDVHVNIETYIWDERDDHLERKLGLFAAGAGPDIFVLDGFMLYPFLENGFLQDIYPMIDASEDWSREDFFEDVLRGHEIDGRLYAMPMSFGFDFAGINANVPREFLDRLADMTHASIFDLAEIYYELVRDFPAWGEFAFINFSNIFMSFAPQLNLAVDFAGQTASFPENFDSSLDSLRSAFANNNRFETGMEVIFSHTEENLQILQDRYVFFQPVGVSGSVESLFEFQSPYFVNFTPLSNFSGELINSGIGMEVAVNYSTDPGLAWAFIGELMSETSGRGDFSASSHIARRFARGYLVTGFEGSFTQFSLRPIVGSQSSQVSQAADRIIIYADMPVSRPVTRLFLPMGTYIDTLRGFADGLFTAQTTLNQIEASITEWLAADKSPIIPYVPAPEIARDGPVQTLTVRTPNMHTGVLRQAESAIKASWQERGIPYEFELIVEDWNWADQEGAVERLTRLNVELMAGGGPDMFLFEASRIHARMGIGDSIELFLLEGHDLRTMAERGFLADINTLIENHPASNRSDFFEHILDALEINGGLYVFPISFGFYRVGVNAQISQPFIDRFLGHNSISHLGLMDFYLDFKAAHSQEFGHFVPGTSWTYGNIQSAVINNMTPFIDFDARVSNLNSPEFAAVLDLLINVFGERELISSGWINNAPVGSFFRERAEEQLFEMEAFKLMGAEAFFGRPSPIFMNYIPFTDDNGNLLFDITRNNTWGSWAITSAGNPALAWEFLTYMLEAYYEPTGRARTEPVWGSTAHWADESIATPIKRSHFESSTRRALERVSSWPGLGFAYRHGDPERELEIDNAINSLAALNEMPVAHLNPLFPALVFNLINEPLEHLRLGIITAEAAAQQIHNSVQLWLLE